ncbi:ABC transporter ATP-binding protein [Anaerocolumna sp. AGMB13020]|uniref:ABC transporter ATP-binding protein n=1 Tax=Anaerocolumna sp. AGMB13020 TaxID=3081750 RepID=UPI0029531E46|nr:ABC transporter ATP-binding protein [Anaerocolumna sp. AGMB13020]WOO34872.1 ABC transporter ATP-binding protein [Anaerocolumna sp. AGMB13020]
MTFQIEVKNVSLKYKKFKALKDISFQLEDQKIYGLIGRNGAGKTSLLSILAGLREATEGVVTVSGEPLFENAEVMEQIRLIYQNDYKDEYRKVEQLIKASAKFSPNFDREYAKTLIKVFKLPKNRAANKLSKGMQSVLDVIIGLASRAPITIFDEAYLGMDAPTRVTFYKELLEEQVRHPRIIILSTHLVSEMDYLFDEVLILKNGSLLLQEEYETLTSKGVTITGGMKEVDEFVQGRRILGSEQLGGTKAVRLYEEELEQLEAKAHEKGLDVGPISLQDLFIYLTEDEAENL